MGRMQRGGFGCGMGDRKGSHGAATAMMRGAMRQAMHGDGMSAGFGAGFGGRFGGRFGGERDGGSGGGRGGGRHGRGRMFAGGELRLFLLHLIAEQDRHGYELIKAIEDLTGGQYAPSPGVVYPTLSLLVDEGMIAEVPGEGARKAFSTTQAGRNEVAAKAEAVAAIAKRLKALAEAQGREASPPVMRAMANLKMALRNRIGVERFDTETAHQIAEILDEAARKVERL